MKSIFKLFSLLVYCLLFFVPDHVFAAGEFQADYNVQYAVAPGGVTIVTQNVTLTNLQTNLYPQKYSITIDSTKIRNVIAYDSGGIVPTDISQKDAKTEIILTFNQKVVGLGKKLEFSLRYESTDIAIKNGSIWEINIPGVARDPDLSTYIVSLRVPAAFGENAYMAPLPASAGRWTKEQMIRGGISAAYGSEQLFDVSLSYYLENTAADATTSEIAIPPDTAFQQVILHSLEPNPKTILRDSDGNWLAQYDLAPSQKLSIAAKATVRVRLTPDAESSQTMSATDHELYTRPLKYWETEDTRILDLAKLFTTPRSIYNYVVTTLSYDYKRAEGGGLRKGALGALSLPAQAICMEFTDLFIAIARAAGIPAREAVGYAYTSNAKLRPLSLVADVLHAWPEYYDAEQKRWIPIDPTWASTTGGINYFDKLDFNHITFAILGSSSEYPYPAGFYKKAGSQSKDVSVRFAENAPDQKPAKLTVTYEFPSLVTAGLSAHGTVVIQNEGTTLMPKATVNIRSSPVDVKLTKELLDFPPFSRISIPVSLDIPNYFQKGKGTIVTVINGETSQFTFDIQPLAYRFLIPLMVAGVAAALALILWKRSKK